MASRVAAQPGDGGCVAALGEAGPAGVPVVDEDRHPAGVERGARWRLRRCPSGRRWRTAAAGRWRRARRRAPRRGRRPRPAPARSSPASSTVHQTARVRSWRGGRSSGSSPSTSPVITRRRRNETTWLVTSTVPKDRVTCSQDRGVRGLDDVDLGDVAGDRRPVRLGPAHQGDLLVEVERGHQVGLALVHVDGARVHRRVRGGAVDRAEQPAGALLDQARPARRPPPGCRRGRWPARAGPVQPGRAAAQQPAVDEVLGHLGRRPARTAPGRRPRSGGSSAAAAHRCGASTYGLAGSSTVASTGWPNSASGWCTR